MAVKRCCIDLCISTSDRSEDIGVTFHKFPKEAILREIWLSATCKKNYVGLPNYVCSRHFCKNDFQIYQDSKYVLKPDSVPSIFPWTEVKPSHKMESEIFNNDVEEKVNTSSSSKESDIENVDAIKKFIEGQEREINEQNKEQEKIREDKVKSLDLENQIDTLEHTEESAVAVSSILDTILTDSEAKISNKQDEKSLQKQSSGGSVALSVGSKVEAKDFGDIWYSAEIIEVDYDEMEVLVHYENILNKPDEWISVNSPRLRPIGRASTPQPEPLPVASQVTAVIDTPVALDCIGIKEEKMPEDKAKITFSVGERCLARWRDSRRFVATITNDLGNGDYEIIFDDGFKWKCNISRLSRLKKSMKQNDSLTIDTSSMSPTTSTPSPVISGDGPISGALNINPLNLPFHTHLFDPARDYLSSKTERREMKRKLNIKEIFNIGQKKRRKPNSPQQRKVRIVKERKRKGFRGRLKRKTVDDLADKDEALKEIPDAVASIIGTVSKSENEPIALGVKEESKDKIVNDSEEKADEISKVNANDGDDTVKDDDVKEDLIDLPDIESANNSDAQNTHSNVELASEEELKLEKFEKPDELKHEEVMDKFKEVINKLEGGLIQADRPSTPKIEKQAEEIVEEAKNVMNQENNPLDCLYEVKDEITYEKQKKKLSKIKKNRKLRLLQEKKVKKQVEKVKSELEEMKRQVEEMKKQMMMKTEELAHQPKTQEMPESFLLPGEWCCKWLNGQPVGTVSELESEPKFDSNNKPVLPRRSVQVVDKRLPPGWTKHMVRRSFGQSAGKWDVVLVGPDNRRFHTKTDMRNYLESNPDESLKPYEYALFDFGAHLKLSRRMGWVKNTGEDIQPATAVVDSTSPLVKRRKMGMKRKAERKEKRRLKKHKYKLAGEIDPNAALFDSSETITDISNDNPVLEDGYVYVGSLKVQVIDNLLRCPAEGCFKNFRNNTLLQMHIKHYHRDLKILMGKTPKVLDLAYARTKPTDKKIGKSRRRADSKIIKVKIPRPAKRLEEPPKLERKPPIEPPVEAPPILPKIERTIPRSQDSPKLRQALGLNKPTKRPKVLLPVRRPDPEYVPPEFTQDEEEQQIVEYDDVEIDNSVEIPLETLDFEMAISTHTVTKPPDVVHKLAEKGDEDEWYGQTSDFDTRSSFPGSPDSKSMDKVVAHNPPPSSESNEEQKDTSNMYMFSETGERIKIEHMKREEIINCHCGFREEDGLMVQCELCLCWQHALCHNIQRESEVPEKYTCSICLNPKRGRRSKRFLHDQDRLYEGLLPGARPCESLRRSHELSGNLLRIQDALHALRVKYYVATKKDHPKLYLWAKDWENAEINMTQEKLNSDYSDLNIIINNIGKENLPVKPDDIRDMHLTAADELAAALAGPGAGLDAPISTLELERLAKTVQEQEGQRAGAGAGPGAPQPEAAIENSACRERLLRHVQRCQALIDARLDSIEAQVAELESQDPSFEDDETADYFPRTKQTIQMLMRDLDTMEELGIIT